MDPTPDPSPPAKVRALNPIPVGRPRRADAEDGPQTIDYLGLMAVISAIAGVGLALSLGLPLLSIVLEQRGISPTMIGINTATAGVAAIIILPFVSTLAKWIGTARLMIGAFVIMAATLMGFYAVETFWIWFPMRFVFAAAVTAIFALTEFWINSLAPNAKRGLIVGVYTAVLSLGISLGPLILALVGTQGALPFIIGAAALLLAATPVVLVRTREPKLPTAGQRNLLRYVAMAPLALGAALVFGAVESGGTAILPLYGTAIGLPPSSAVILVSAIAVGNVLSQIPIGYLADKMNRRVLLIAIAIVGVLGALLMPLASQSYYALLAVLFVTGGIVAGLYTVGLVHLGARYRGGDLASANAAFVMMYAVGMLVGPITLGLGLDIAPPNGFPLMIAALFAVYVAVAFLRIGRRGIAEGAPGS